MAPVYSQRMERLVLLLVQWGLVLPLRRVIQLAPASWQSS